MAKLRLILADQISESITSLEGLAKNDIVLMCEIMRKANYASDHPKKIVFLFSIMRHFAEKLSQQDINVRYMKLDNANNTGNLTEEAKRVILELKPERIVVTEPSEYHVLAMIQKWQETFNLPVEIRPDTRFLANHSEFKRWARDKKQLRMEFFYREMRQKYDILMEADRTPTGGVWNYDKENRKPPKSSMISPKRISHEKSKITCEVLKLVKSIFSHHFGNLEPFHFAVTREEALIELEHFISKLLPQFGDYQDAMVTGEAYFYHSLLSCYLNAGLLLPLEICKKAEAAYKAGKAPLNATEGFIRQILCATTIINSENDNYNYRFLTKKYCC